MAKKRVWLLTKWKDHSIYLIVEVILRWRQPWRDFAWDNNISILFGKLERAIHILFKQMSASPLFNPFSSKSIHNHLAQPKYMAHRLVYNHADDHFSTQAKCPTIFSFYYCLWVAQETVLLICLLLGGTWRGQRTVCNPDPSLFFLSQWKIGHIQWDHECMLERPEIIIGAKIKPFRQLVCISYPWLQDWLKPITDTSLLFGDELLLCNPTLLLDGLDDSSRWIFQFAYYVVAHDQAFCFH